MGRKQDRKLDYIRLINNGNLLLTSENKYQEVNVNGTKYLVSEAHRDPLKGV